MRLLADENVPGAVVRALTEAGYEVAWGAASAPGAGDADVLARAVKEGRVLLTFDTDFGTLIFNDRLPIPAGVVLFRLAPRPAGDLARFAVEVLASRDDWEGHFAVVDDRRIRLRPLNPERRTS